MELALQTGKRPLSRLERMGRAVLCHNETNRLC